MWLTLPVEIIGDSSGWVTGMRCQKMELGEPDASGRRRPVAVEGSEFLLDVDTVIYALGTTANPIIAQTTPGLEVNKWGYIDMDERTGMTSIPGVFAGGDIVTGAATVILAMGAGNEPPRECWSTWASWRRSSRNWPTRESIRCRQPVRSAAPLWKKTKSAVRRSATHGGARAASS